MDKRCVAQVLCSLGSYKAVSAPCSGSLRPADVYVTVRDSTDKRKISKEITSFVILRLSINSSPPNPVMREWPKTLDEETN
jgi:hypothetical protein